MDSIVTTGIDLIPMEIKYKDIKKVEISKSIKSFIMEYKPKKLLIVNKSFEQQVEIQDTQYI